MPVERAPLGPRCSPLAPARRTSPLQPTEPSPGARSQSQFLTPAVLTPTGQRAPPAERHLSSTRQEISLSRSTMRSIKIDPQSGRDSAHDQELTSCLRAGDEAAFREVVAEYGGRLSRLARSFSRNDAVIEEAVQETWLAVIRGIQEFQGRAPLRTWIFGILVNQARRLAVREHRHAQATRVANTAMETQLSREDVEDREPGMGSVGMWVEPPAPWGLRSPESAILAAETLGVVQAALVDLPEVQRQVVLLRDVEGMDSREVCNMLRLSGTNQRVLLHRGRARVRRALDRYMREGALERRSVRRERKVGR